MSVARRSPGSLATVQEQAEDGKKRWRSRQVVVTWTGYVGGAECVAALASHGPLVVGRINGAALGGSKRRDEGPRRRM
jgi:hypothetical protein